MILAPSPIWTPPRWSAADFLDRFTAGKWQRKSTGKAQRKTSTGKMKRNGAVSSTCCCPVTCARCSGGTTPSSIQLVFAGVTLCTCATSTISGGIGGKATGTFPTFAICCAQTSCNGCIYETVLTASQHSLRGTMYSDVGCTTPNTHVNFGNLLIRVSKSSNTTYTVLAELQDSVVGTCDPGFPSASIDLFSGSVVVSSLVCAGTFTVNNGFTNCVASGSGGIGGTATISSPCS